MKSKLSPFQGEGNMTATEMRMAERIGLKTKLCTECGRRTLYVDKVPVTCGRDSCESESEK